MSSLVARKTGGRDGQLLILRDQESGREMRLPKRVAPDAGVVAVSGNGRVVTFTVNHHPYHPQIPVLHVIELDEQEGLRLPANIVNCAVEDVQVGMRTRAALEDHGEVFVPGFEPDA